MAKPFLSPPEHSPEDHQPLNPEILKLKPLHGPELAYGRRLLPLEGRL